MDLLESFRLHPETAKELYLWASEIVEDCDDYGMVIQSNEDGENDNTTAIGRLRVVRDSVISAIESCEGSTESLKRPLRPYR